MKRKYSLLYPKKLVYNHILFDVSVACNVSPSIIKADINSEQGRIVAMFDGKSEDVEKALSMLREHGVEVALVQ